MGAEQHVFCLCADESFPLHGVVKRTQVLRMLKHRSGLFVHDGMSAWPPATARIPKSQVSGGSY